MALIGSRAPLSLPFPIKGKGDPSITQPSAAVFVSVADCKLMTHFVGKSLFPQGEDDIFQTIRLGRGSLETRPARVSILPVPCPGIRPVSCRLSAVCRQKSEMRGRPNRRIHRRVDRSPSVCKPPGGGVNPSGPERRLLCRGNL